MSRKCLASVALILMVAGAFGQEQSAQEKTALKSFKVAPSYFIPNQVNHKTGKRVVDQDEVVAFVQTPKGRVMFTPSGAYIGMPVLTDPRRPVAMETFAHKGMVTEHDDGLKTRMVVLKAGFSKGHATKRNLVPRLEEPSGATVNFFTGPEENWQTGIPSYQKLVYDDVWDGVTLEYVGFIDRLEFRLLLEPGSDPTQIALEMGTEHLSILDGGSLSVQLEGAEMRVSAPYAYQIQDRLSVPVTVQYRLLGKGRVGFDLGTYVAELPLIIDPELTWSTYLGGGGGDGLEEGKAIAVDSDGNAYVVGRTPAGDYPTTTGAIDESWNGDHDVFVSKLNASGTGLVYSTFLGGAAGDIGNGVAVDSSSNVYVIGYTLSLTFPTTDGAFSESHSGGDGYDVFVSKLDSSGANLSYSTFLGSTSYGYGNGIAVDSSGSAYVIGSTRSSEFPTTSGAYDESQNGNSDVFVSKLNENGTSLIYSTFLGGGTEDYGNGIAVDSDGNAYVTGRSSSFPTTSGAYNETSNGELDLFVTKLNQDATSLIYSTFIGGTNNDIGFAIAVDSDGNAYVTGYTGSATYPTTSGAYDESYNSGHSDVFVSKLNAGGSNLIYSTFLGGSSDEVGFAIAVDSDGNAYVTGYTGSATYPTISGAYDESYNSGYSDVFVSKLNADGTNLIYSTFLGGTDDDQGNGIAVDSNGNAFVCGTTKSPTYPTTSGAYDESYNSGLSDVFVSKLNEAGTNLVYSTFLAGSGSDFGGGIAVDGSNSTYIVGGTQSSNFPTTSGAYDEPYNGDSDVYVSKMNLDGTNLVYSSFLGGSDYDAGLDIAVDSFGNAYITGLTVSLTYPTTNGAYDESHNGYGDVFVSKLNASGTNLIYSTLLGGSSTDSGYGIAVDSSGSAYLTGRTYSTTYPTTIGAYDESYNGNIDVFVSKLNGSGTSLVYSTFLGGSSWDYGQAIAVDGSNNAYVTGYTDYGYVTNFPSTSGAFDESHNGGRDVFVCKLNSSGGLSYSSYLGGTDDDHAYGIAVNDSGNAYVTGYTESSYQTNFPSTSGAFDVILEGRNVFVSKLNGNGTGLIYSTFLNGYVGYGIALDSGGNAYMTGFAYSETFPTTSCAYDQSHNGTADVFVSKLNANGTTLLYSSFLGSTSYEYGNGIAVDNVGNAYVTGRTVSLGFPTTNGAYDESLGGRGDAFVLKLDLSVGHVMAHIAPGSQALGLDPPVYDLGMVCDLPLVQVDWMAMPPTALVITGTQVTLDPPPNVTTVIEVMVEVAQTKTMVTDQAILLVAVNTGYEDLNGDGCNNLLDLWDLAQFWGQPFAGDPDDDGFITVMDLLYINLNDPIPCPL